MALESHSSATNHTVWCVNVSIRLTLNIFQPCGTICLFFVTFVPINYCVFGYFLIFDPLKDTSQPPPFSLPSKLLILHGEAKSYCLTVSCVPE